MKNLFNELKKRLRVFKERVERFFRKNTQLAYFLISLFFMVYFTIYFVGGSSYYDIHLHSTSARIAYEGIINKNPKITDFFDINLLKTTSMYHIYFVLMFYIIKNSHIIIFTWYLMYFSLWSYGSYKLLKASNKLNLFNFFIMSMLSLNSGVSFGMPSFMIGEALFLIFLAKITEYYKVRGRKKIILATIAFALSSYIIHALFILLGIYIGLLFYFYAEKKPLDVKKYIAYSLMLSLVFSIPIVINIYDQYKYNKASYIKSFEDILVYLLQTFLFIKPFSFFVINGIFSITILIPIFYLVSNERIKLSNKLFQLVLYVILIYLLLIPDVTPTSYMLSGRLFVFIIISMLLAYEIRKDQLTVAIVIIVFFTNLLFINTEAKKIVDVFLAQDRINYNVERSDVDEFLEKNNVKSYYSVLTEINYGRDYKSIDKGIIFSNSYIYKSHPVSMKEIISSKELENGEISKNIFKKRNLTIVCDYVKENLNKICKFFDVLVVNEEKCQFKDDIENALIFESENNITIYSCNEINKINNKIKINQS